MSVGIPAAPSVICPACEGEGIGSGYVPELCGEGEDQACESCSGSGRIELPWQWVVCSQCRGHGTSSAYLGAFTAEQMREDPEFAEDYMRGDYDRTCETCGGRRVVPEPDRQLCDPKLLAAYDAQQADEAAARREERNIYLMEGGWREEWAR